MTKKCSDCQMLKSKADFSKDSSRGDGLAYRCRDCSSSRGAKYYRAHVEEKSAKSRAVYEANKAARNEQIARWQKDNADRVRENKRRYREANKQAIAAKNSEWARNNRAKLQARDSKRRAAKLRATPVWADDFAIQEAYDLAQLRTAMFGFGWSVDHIVPLRSPLVCGLHVEHNIRVIPTVENKAKGNRYWPDMP